MDGVNLEALLRKGRHFEGRRHWLGHMMSEPTNNPNDEGNHHQPSSSSRGFDNSVDSPSFTAIHSRAVDNKPTRVSLAPNIDLVDDTLDFQAYWNALFFPEVYMPIFYAARITLTVALPLAVLSYHPDLFPIFPAHIILTLWGIVSCRYTAGDQISFFIMGCQTAVWVIIWGVVNNACGTRLSGSRWWCALIFGVFAVSLLGDIRCKRLLVLMTVLMLQMENLPGGGELTFPIKVARDLVMSLSFSLVQVFFPPLTACRQCDDLLAKAWKDIGTLIHNAVEAVWTDDPVESAILLSNVNTAPLQAVFSVAPAQLIHVMYEFWESTLRLELRRERLNWMRRIMPLIHALVDTTRTVVMDNPLTVNGVPPEHDLHVHDPFDESTIPKEMERSTASVTGNVDTMPQRVDAIPPHHPRAQWDSSRNILKDALKNYLTCFDATMDGLGKHLDPVDTVEKVPFHDLRNASADLQSAINKMHYELLIKSDRELNPFVYISICFLHLTLVNIAEILVEYGELMQNFDRRRYKSQWRRAWEFFFYDHWYRFWRELPCRLTLARPRDVRILKDSIKMSCAYAVGVMFSTYLDPENVYYFGMAILMGVGWPTAGDTMVASIYRITGMLCASSIAFVAVWHTQNLAGELALSLAAVFISLLFREVPVYSHTAQYCSMLIITSLSSASHKLVLLSRIISNCFTVMSYYAICVFIFPIDVVKVTFATETQALVFIMDRLSSLVDIAALPLMNDETESDDRVHEQLTRIAGQRNEMWVKVLALAPWLIKAENEPATHGLPYPLQEQKGLLLSLRRLASATDIITSSLISLYRHRSQRPKEAVCDILASVAPTIQLVEAHAREVVGDFIDATHRPFDWSIATATRHFSSFLSLSEVMSRTFVVAHQRNVRVLRMTHLQEMMHRTFVGMSTSNGDRPIESTVRLHVESVDFSRKGSVNGVCDRDAVMNNSIAAVADQAEEDVYRSFTCKRQPNFLLDPEEYTINDDVNMVICILVAVGMFFSEAEKLLKTMCVFNKYQRSQQRQTKNKKS